MTEQPPSRRWRVRLGLIRVTAVLAAVFGINYLVWRWLDSINWSAAWIAVPLILAETYSLIDTFFFGATMWRLRDRGEPPPPAPDATVDVFITTYNEPVDLVMDTARAAHRIRFPHQTWVLDDGDRSEMRAAAEGEGIGYLTRSTDWADRPRHAKAGNLNNALFVTEGEFLLILDADQVPLPAILDRTLGYFTEPRVAIVQTPQYFVNVEDHDPLGCQSPLFYGPIQQGKDGWNAAFFCGSNAVLRRDALMQLGVVGYVRAVQTAVRDALRAAGSVVAKARTQAREYGPGAVDALDQIDAAVRLARTELRAGEPVAVITLDFQERIDAASRGMVSADLEELKADLAEIEALPIEADRDIGAMVVDEAALDRLADREWSPLGALEEVRALIKAVDVDLDSEAQPIMPVATISVTEDMTTAMRLHALGWRSVYHHEILAHGLAPESLATMLGQRLRWAQGTMQVLLKENPLTKPGLSPGQRIMYFATMWSYLCGFAAIVYIACPVLYLLFTVRPVQSFSGGFMARLIPYLLCTQAMFLAVGYGIKTWRGQQYSLALFPLWIRACVTATGNVFFGRKLGFVVTPKVREERREFPWRLIWPQLTAIVALAGAAIVGLVRLAFGWTAEPGAIWINLAWVVYDLVVLSVIIEAARYQGPPTEERTA
ncbi:MAG TPA: glycosyltransferase family 2 protein [Actinophytocola sp.]|uniref:glycosyltransferase family 2 protein n=1 Tax=Actinophytocola sp. TaxID=1872138 RepID=UPI002DB6603E|nr:glycosyltransferase family 2 protein [Actinophytocola sp.]HEU5472445.1 glycosyltransferase family 2 protein [Actinophytocola sp.]